MHGSFCTQPPERSRAGAFGTPAGLAAVVATSLLLAACGGGPESDRAGGEGEPPPDQTYTVRGQVVALPARDTPGRNLRVRHEAVPDFVGVEGEVVGMASMTMPFPLAEGVSLEDVEVGDTVEMTFEVRWDGSEPLRVVELRELPPGTTLDFEVPREPMPGEEDVEGTGSQPP